MTGSPQGVIVAFGEVLWDEFPDGARLGGAPCNFAVCCAGLGAATALVSAVGHDDRGDEALRLIGQRGVDIERVQRSDLPTGRVEVQLSEGHPSYTIVENVAWDRILWQPELAELAAEARVLCFGTLAQRTGTNRDTLARLAGLTPPDCVKVVDINFRQHFHNEAVVRRSLELATVLKLSDEEVPTLHGYLGGPADCNQFLAGLLETCGLETIVLTLGSQGCAVFAPGEQFEVPSVPVEVVNTVGAGDAFTATYLTQRLAGADRREAARKANQIGGYVATCDSATPELPGGGERSEKLE